MRQIGHKTLLLSIFIGFLQENQVLHVFFFILRQRLCSVLTSVDTILTLEM